MANTYTQIYLHCIFAVQDRISLIKPTWKDELYKYITGIVQNNGHKMIAINGMPDHVHIFIGYKPHQLISDLIQDVKGFSSKWINQKKFVKSKFHWQAGYGAFSYSDSQIDNVVKYIQNQETHHKKRNFREEYVAFLEKHGVKYDPRYIMRNVDC